MARTCAANGDNVMPRVLLVVRSDSQGSEAYHVIRLLKESGYSIDTCSSTIDPSKSDLIKTDFVLDESMSTKQYEGVIFLDDGGDDKESVRLAKEADDQGIAIGGCGPGALILEEAGLLKDKQVSSMLPFKPKSSESVEAPSVRCENVVTSSGDCVDGFIVVFVDALGGEIKKIVKGGDEPVPALTAMVVSKLHRWPEYWRLASRLSSKGIGLVIADWQDVDLKSKKLTKALILRCPSMPRLVSDLPLPSSSWFKQTSMGTNESISAVEQLEAAGVSNVNSSMALRMTSNKVATSEAISSVTSQGGILRFSPKNSNEAADLLLSKGVRWTKPVDGSLGEKILRVIGHDGEYSIVSSRPVEEPKHSILAKEKLAKLISEQYKDDFIVQEDIGEIRVGTHTAELRFVMRRRSSGWTCSCETARFGMLLSNPYSQGQIKESTAAQACSMAFGDEWHDRLESARELAHKCCVAFQSSLPNPTDASELAVDITFSGDEPRVIEINGVPDLTGTDEAFRARDKVSRFARRMGCMPIVYIPMSDLELERSRADMDEPLAERIDDETYFRNLRAELSRLQVHFQRDNTVVIEDGKRMTAEEAINDAKEEAMEYLALLRSIERHNESRQKMFRSLLLKRVHKLCLLREYDSLTKKRQGSLVARKVLSYNRQPTGPYQYLPEEIGTPTPWEENETTDYDPVKMQLNRPRRHPEYFYGWKFWMYLPGTPQEDLYPIDRIEKLINEGGSCYPFIASNWE